MPHRKLPSKLSQLRRRLYMLIPEWIRERDFELFTAFLCFLGGLTLLVSGVEAGSMEEALPSTVVIIWALVLVICPFAIVLGVGMAHKYDYPDVIKWMRVEASGLRITAYAAYLYAVILLLIAGLVGFAPFIVVIFALTCHSRATNLTIDVENYFALLRAISHDLD
jgi:uncharacterized membrane protein